jgi:hypothetical protein
MIRICLIVTATALALLVQPTWAKPLRLAPADEWRLLQNEASCELIRKFGSGDDAVTLLLELSGPEPHFNFSAFGQPMKKVGRGDIEVRFGPNEAPTKRPYLFGKDGRGTPFVIMHGVRLAPPAETIENRQSAHADWPGAEREANITELSLANPLWRTITLELDPMGEHLRQIRVCADTLSKRLEDGPAGIGLAHRPTPTGSPGEWIISSDYPPGLVLEGIEGR